MDITEIQDELLRLEYPNLLPDHDPDIERYYYLRSIGQSADALVMYQNRLVPRYPDNHFRTWLLRSYRSHDPIFRSLLAQGYRLLGQRSLDRIKRVILIIAEKADSFNEKDIYSTIKTAEEILQFLSPDRYEALSGIERFLRYSTVLDLRAKSMTRAEELVRSYLTDTLSVVEEERRRRSAALRRAEEAERKRLVKADWDSYHYQRKYGTHGPFIDLSAVVFSPEDLARIEVPDFARLEDRVLGYCIKYWNRVDDPAFERILFLYSRKYGKKNYDVYMTMRRGQMARRRDDEILASIMGVLVTGYYYSIQGDLYLQRNWNVIKNNLANQGPVTALPAQLPPPKAAVTIPALPAPKKTTAKKQPAGSRRGAKTAAVAGKKPAAKSKASANIKAAVKNTVSAKSRALPKSKPEAVLKPPAIAPRPKSKAAPKIAPRPALAGRPAAAGIAAAKRPAAVVARAAGKSSVPSAPQAPVKVPYKLKPAEQPKTTIITRPVVLRPETAPARPHAIKAAAAPKPFMAKEEAVVTPFSTKSPVQKTAAAKKPPKQDTAKSSPAIKAAGYKPAPFTPASPPRKTRKIKVITNKTLGAAKGSVQDRLRELSGRSYDVYEDRFLSKARSAIRKVLGTGKGMFFNLPEEAEDLVYNFLRDHYADPYMDWEAGADRKNLLGMGFDLPSINPVIDECYRSL